MGIETDEETGMCTVTQLREHGKKKLPFSMSPFSPSLPFLPPDILSDRMSNRRHTRNSSDANISTIFAFLSYAARFFSTSFTKKILHSLLFVVSSSSK